MKKLLIICLGGCVVSSAWAQTPEDALRNSYYAQSGTARSLAIGGAMGSLGGDLSATFVNPAGLGFFRTGEFVLTPSVFLKNNKLSYFGNETSTKKNAFSIGTSGLVFGAGSAQKGKWSSAFAVAATQSASFNNQTKFSALNNQSSFSEQFAEEFAKSGLSIQDVLNTNSALPYTAAPALNAFLIDTVRVGGTLQVRGAAEKILDAGQALMQTYDHSSTGGLYELAIGAGFNNNDKWLLGASLGIPILNYESFTSLTETDTSSNKLNGFNSATFTDKFTSTGAGLNLKLGAIYRPVEYVRLGISVQTPSVMVLTDKRVTTVLTKLETPMGNPEGFSERSTTYTNGVEGQSDYRQKTPWRVVASGSYVFRETEDVSRQAAFLTADLEYVNYNGSKFKTVKTEDGVGNNVKDYYKDLNNVIDAQYKGTFNFRAGAEVKFTTIMARVGAAYYGNPYAAETGIKSDKLRFSGGLGYRDKGMFIDLTYIYDKTKDVVFPYRLQDRDNFYATAKRNTGNVVATLGFKF